MKNIFIIIMTIFTIGLLFPFESIAKPSPLTSNIAGNPGYMSLTKIISSGALTFDITTLQDTDIISAKITFAQADPNAAISILSLLDVDGNILKAISIKDSGAKEYIGLKSLINTSNTNLSLKFDAQDLDPAIALTLTSIQLEVSYYSLDVTSPQVSTIRVEELKQNSALISWMTDESSISKIKYGKTSNYTQIQSEILPEVTGTGGNTNTNSTKHSALILNLFSGTTYHFQIIAEDPAGNISSTKGDTFITPLTQNENLSLSDSNALNAMTIDLVGELGFTDTFQVNLKWSHRDTKDISGFFVYRQDENSVIKQIDKVGALENVFVDRNVERGRVYKYSIRAYKDSTVSSQSSIYEINIDPTNLNTGSQFVRTDLNKTIIFISSITIGTLIVLYFLFKKMSSIWTILTIGGLGKNKLKDSKFVQNDFEKRFIDSVGSKDSY